MEKVYVEIPPLQLAYLTCEHYNTSPGSSSSQGNASIHALNLSQPES